MPDVTFDYPFDPTGKQASNKIIGEKHSVSPPAWKDYHFIIPKMAPFFRDSIKLVKLPDRTPLVEGVDYVVTHLFHDASLAVAKPVYGSITFYDKEFAGIVEIEEYQTLGGEWTIDDTTISEILINNHVNPRITTWEQVVETPHQFPVIDHEWHLDDMVGMSEVEAAILRIADVILITGDPEISIDDHLQRTDNPHSVTKLQVGLGDVENFAVASRAEAEAGSLNNRYMTPQRTAQAIVALGHSYTDAHEERDDNPHGVTKTQVGLSAVQNYAVATQGEAEGGATNSRYMTPLRVSQAISKQALEPLAEHLDDNENPHQVTKSQVGLGSVENYEIASLEEAVSGSTNSRYMTPLRTRQAIEQIANQSAGAHSGRTDNPHEVTIEQVGGYSTDYIDALIEDLVNRDILASDSARFGGQTPEEFAASFGGGGDDGSVLLLIDSLTERYELAYGQMSGFEVPEFGVATGAVSANDVEAGYHATATFYSDGTVTIDTFPGGDINGYSGEVINALNLALGVNAYYFADAEGVVNAVGSSQFTPPSGLEDVYVTDIWAGRYGVAAMDHEGDIIAWGHSNQNFIWDELNGSLGKGVDKVVMGYTQNGFVLKLGEILPFGNGNFKANATSAIDSILGTRSVVDAAIGPDKFIVLLDDDSIYAWNVNDPTGAATTSPITLPLHLQKGIDVHGWGSVFAITNYTGYVYFIGNSEVESLDTEEWGLIEASAAGVGVVAAVDVNSSPYQAQFSV